MEHVTITQLKRDPRLINRRKADAFDSKVNSILDNSILYLLVFTAGNLIYNDYHYLGAGLALFTLVYNKVKTH